MTVSNEVNTPIRRETFVSHPAEATTTLYAGTLGAINAAGNAVPAADAANLRVQGRIEDSVDNSTGGAGDQQVRMRQGVFRFNNSTGDAITRLMIGAFCFVEDAATVNATGGANKIRAGQIIDVDDDGVWVDTDAMDFAPVAVTTNNANGAIAAISFASVSQGCADLAAATETLADDVRAIAAALKTQGIIK